MEKSLVLVEKIKELSQAYLGKDRVDLLTSSTPKEWKKTRPIRGGGNVEYVPGPRFIQRANDAFGFLWSFEMPEATEKIPGQLVGKGRLTVHVPVVKKRTVRTYSEDGKQVREVSEEFEEWKIVKEQYGGVDIKTWTDDKPAKDRKGNPLQDSEHHLIYEHRKGSAIDVGDDYKSVSTEAFKKCCTGFGMFLDVYGARDDEVEGGADEVQYEVLFMRGQQAGMDETQTKEWAVKELGKALSEADEMEIMSLIPKLVAIKKG